MTIQPRQLLYPSRDPIQHCPSQVSHPVDMFQTRRPFSLLLVLVRMRFESTKYSYSHSYRTPLENRGYCSSSPVTWPCTPLQGVFHGLRDFLASIHAYAHGWTSALGFGKSQFGSWYLRFRWGCWLRSSKGELLCVAIRVVVVWFCKKVAYSRIMNHMRKIPALFRQFPPTYTNSTNSLAAPRQYPK